MKTLWLISSLILTAASGLAQEEPTVPVAAPVSPYQGLLHVGMFCLLGIGFLVSSLGILFRFMDKQMPKIDFQEAIQQNAGLGIMLGLCGCGLFIAVGTIISRAIGW